MCDGNQAGFALTDKICVLSLSKISSTCLTDRFELDFIVVCDISCGKPSAACLRINFAYMRENDVDTSRENPDKILSSLWQRNEVER